MTEEEWQDREKQYHEGIWRLLSQIWDLENEIRRLKGEDQQDEDTKNIVPIRRYGNVTGRQ
jgi:hypothetical protein